MNYLHTAHSRLEESGVRPSTIRVHVLAYLLSHPIHPTVEQIYHALQPRILTLSKTTVYNTLDLLTEAGLVRQIAIDGREAHYDANTAEHGHFQCLHCRQIYDFEADLEHVQTRNLTGFRVDEKYLYFTGFCPACHHKNNQEEVNHEKSDRYENSRKLT